MPVDASLLNLVVGAAASGGVFGLSPHLVKLLRGLRSGLIAEADRREKEREIEDRRIQEREAEAWARADAEISRLATTLRQERDRAAEAEADCHRWKQTARAWEAQAHRMRHALAFMAQLLNAMLTKASEVVDGRAGVDCFRDIVTRYSRVPRIPLLPGLEQVNDPAALPGLLPGEVDDTKRIGDA